MKRMTDTAKWENPWFRRLSPAMKSLWLYLCDKCDPAGVIEFDPEDATFRIGERITFKDLDEMGARVTKLKSGKYHLPGFLAFQYRTLSTDSPAHKPVFDAIKRHGLRVPSSLKKLPYPVTPSARVGTTLQDKDKDKDRVIDKGKRANGATPARPETVWSLQQRIQAATDEIERVKGGRQLKDLPDGKKFQISLLRGSISGWRKEILQQPVEVDAASLGKPA